MTCDRSRKTFFNMQIFSRLHKFNVFLKDKRKVLLFNKSIIITLLRNVSNISKINIVISIINMKNFDKFIMNCYNTKPFSISLFQMNLKQNLSSFFPLIGKARDLIINTFSWQMSITWYWINNKDHFMVLNELVDVE